MIRNSFEKGTEGWHSYDYHASIINGGPGIFILTTRAAQGGVNNSGYIWTTELRWSTDVPERPISILPLMIYRHWTGEGPIDLREAEVSVYLRGDGLELYGAQCFFWVHKGGSRWHCTSEPIPISDGCWASAPSRVVLRNNESLWHRSWAHRPASLDSALGNVISYGFSFVGFAREVHGKLSMDEFQIKLRGE